MRINDIMEEMRDDRLCELEAQILEVQKVTNKMKKHIIDATKLSPELFIECYNRLSEITEIG